VKEESMNRGRKESHRKLTTIMIAVSPVPKYCIILKNIGIVIELVQFSIVVS
jgi:hypothetical protein